MSGSTGKWSPPPAVQPLGPSLNGLLKRLERALETQRAFVADAAHELRTPLTALRLQAQIAERASEQTERGEAIGSLKQGVERASHLVGGSLCPAEHHGQPASGRLQDPGEHLDLVELVSAEHILLGQRHMFGLVVLLGPHVHGPLQVPAGERDHLTRHGGREEHGLPAGRGQLQDALDVGKESQVQHLVGLVEDECGHVRQVEVVLARQVEQPARSADHDVHCRAQGLDLWFVGPAAIEGEHPRPAPRPCRRKVLGYLDRQFPGGHDDQCAGSEGAAVRGLAEALQERDAERQRLARSRPCLADDVVIGERDREG